MDVRRGSGFLWLDADFLVSEALTDFAKGKAMSGPGRPVQGDHHRHPPRPHPPAQRFQNVGRK